ncbi:MAG TPA: fimbria/pilus periplasmic chaperone, partial [Nitrospirota bacterium]|nr:fimbria/pilus periplasmic chaperone [Nitrospirota bacterium]
IMLLFGKDAAQSGPASSSPALLRTGLMTALLFVSFSFCHAFAADFQIQPTTLELSGGARSGAFSVINNGNESINFQVSVKEWTQDANGKDVYEDTKDIVFFPKIMTTGPNEQRAIRIGLKAPLSVNEKTYRLFVEEIPSPKKGTEMKEQGKIKAGITIAFRFATPIFVKPLKQQESAAVEKVEMSKGVVQAMIKNTGNVHIKLLSVMFRGKAADGRVLFSKEIAGWYILHGLSIPYKTAVPKEACEGLATIEVNAKSENLAINGAMNVKKGMCAP